MGTTVVISRHNYGYRLDGHNPNIYCEQHSIFYHQLSPSDNSKEVLTNIVRLL